MAGERMRCTTCCGCQISWLDKSRAGRGGRADIETGSPRRSGDPLRMRLQTHADVRPRRKAASLEPLPYPVVTFRLIIAHRDSHPGNTIVACRTRSKAIVIGPWCWPG